MASSGVLWTSINKPSAPATTAARDIGATRERLLFRVKDQQKQADELIPLNSE